MATRVPNPQTVVLVGLLVLFVFCCGMLGYSVGKHEQANAWKPVPNPHELGPAPLVADSDVTRKGYWYSWYYNDQGELLFKRGGKSTMRLQIRYTNGTTEDL